MMQRKAPLETAGSPAPSNENTDNSIESRIERLTREIQSNTAHINELIRMSDGDNVTSVLNRRAFLREGNRLCLMARRHKFPLSALYVNLDGFQRINDAYGRRGGDAVLEHIGVVLNQLLRGSDLVGRVGADEFCGMLTHCDDATAETKGNQLREMLMDDPPRYLDRNVPVSFTFSAVSCDGRMIDEVMDDAVRGILEQRQHRLP